MLHDMGVEYVATWATRLAHQLDCTPSTVAMAYRNIMDTDALEAPDYGSLAPAQVREVISEARSLRLLSVLVADDPHAARYEIWD